MKEAKENIEDPMAGTLDPTVREFVPQSSRSEPQQYDSHTAEQPHSRTRGYRKDYAGLAASDRADSRPSRRSYNDRFYEYEDFDNSTQSSFPSSQELKAFYQELQSGGWENQQQRPPKSSYSGGHRADYHQRGPHHYSEGSKMTPHHSTSLRNSPPPRAHYSLSPHRYSPPPRQRHSPPPQQHHHHYRGPTERSSPPPPRQQRVITSEHPQQRRARTAPPPQRNSPPPRQRSSPPPPAQNQRRVSPQKQKQPSKPSSNSFANVARTSLERQSTPSPTTENRTNTTTGLSASETREQSSTNSAERRSPPKTEASYDADAEVNLIRSQLEFYFSDKNLFEEINSNLIFYMLQGKMWVPVHVVCALPKVRELGGKREDVLNALRTSSLLELNDNEDKIRRPGYQLPPDFKVRKSLRRSVLVYGLPQQMTDKGVRELLDSHGNIMCVAFPQQSDGPDIETGRIIMKKKLGEPANLMKLTCAFVVFESQSQANKCVKARSRSSSDGIRTMHKYDYNKVVKRLGKGMSPNSSPLWTPTASPSFNSEPRSCSLSGATPTFNSTPGFKLSPAHGGSHGSPQFGSRSMSRSPGVRSMNSRSPFYRSHGSPGVRSQRSPSWKLEENGEMSHLRQRSSSSQNRRVIVAKGPDSTKGFRWPRNPRWKKTRTTLDVLNNTMV